MNPCKHIEKNLYLYYFEALTTKEKVTLEKHLQSCPACAQKAKDIQATMAVLNQRKPPELTPQFWEDFDQELAAKIEQPESPVTKHSPTVFPLVLGKFKWIPDFFHATGWLPMASGAAAVLLIGFVLLVQNPKQPAHENLTASLLTPPIVITPDAIVDQTQYPITRVSVDEVLIQDMLLLSALGENLMADQDEDLVHEAELLTKYSAN